MCSPALLRIPSSSPHPLQQVSKDFRGACTTCDKISKTRTVLHKLRHAKDHDHRDQTHQDHRVLEDAHDAESTSRLVEVLQRRGTNVDFQLAAPRRAHVRALVAPFVSAEGLEHMHELLRRLALGVSNIHAVGCKEVVTGVDGEEIAGFGDRFENEGVVAAERGRELDTGCADEDSMG